MVEAKFMRSSGNVFADMGLPNPEVRLLKSQLASQIQCAIEKRGLSEEELYQLIDLSPSEVQNVLGGRLAEIAVERLFAALNGLGHSVEVRVSSNVTDDAHTLMALT